MNDLSELCIHTITNKPWSIEKALDKYCEKGIGGISIWKEATEGWALPKLKQKIDSYPIQVVSYVRGGFFPSVSKEKRRKAVSDNQKLIEETATIGAPLLVLVCGAEPAQNIQTSRKQILEGIEAILPFAETMNVKLGIEPLHPMYADTRSAINSLALANQVVKNFKSPHLGIVVDVYHLWWEPNLKNEILRCGKNDHLQAFHICDWKVPTTDLLLDREIMGKGCIQLSEITSWVEQAGFKGFYEVEIFSNTYWAQDQDQYLEQIVNAFAEMIK